MEVNAEEKPAVAFKSVRKRKNLRQRKNSEEDVEQDRNTGKQEGEEDFDREALIETMEKQKLRQRSAGISNITLAVGRKVTKAEEMAAKDADPFKIKSGGLVDLHTARRRLDEENGGVAEGKGRGSDKLGTSDVVGTQFSKETKIRDEDEEMRKFIESEMEKRRGKSVNQDEVEENSYKSPEDKALLSLPEHLSKSTFTKNEEMLSSAMLSGIPEVDLGIEEKIRNIKATEEAKKLQRERAERAARPSKFVPANIAVNFKGKEEGALQAKRTKSDPSVAASDATVVTQRTVVVGDEPEERRVSASSSGGAVSDPTKATDDATLAKFKSNFGGKRKR